MLLISFSCCRYRLWIWIKLPLCVLQNWVLTMLYLTSNFQIRKDHVEPHFLLIKQSLVAHTHIIHKFGQVYITITHGERIDPVLMFLATSCRPPWRTLPAGCCWLRNTWSRRSGRVVPRKTQISLQAAFFSRERRGAGCCHADLRSSWALMW